MLEGQPSTRPLRVAVVVHMAFGGGIARFAKALVDGMLAAEPDVQIGFFAEEGFALLNGLESYFEGTSVELIVTAAAIVDESGEANGERPSARRGLIWGAARDLISMWPSARTAARRLVVWGRRVRGLEEAGESYPFPESAAALLPGYDVVYLALPLWLDPFDPGVPVVGTFHDLNYKHFPENFDERGVRKWRGDFEGWLSVCTTAVVSTHFVADDLGDEFPQAKGKTEVIYVAPYGVRTVTEAESAAALGRFGLLDETYVIYPANITPHKNILAFVQAAEVLKHRMGNDAPKFVITGVGTELFTSVDPPEYVGRILDFIHAAGLVLGRDVIATGYVSDVEIDALTASAALVVSTSLYEAGCGPALDAWRLGVPVAFSNIPPFVEQLDALGVEALVFDPRDPVSIADQIQRACDEPELMREMVERSKSGIREYTWVDVGRQYLDVLRRAAARVG